MPIECRRTTTGGKGNRGMFIERDSNIVAAGLPSAEQGVKLEDLLPNYQLVDATDALIGDAIIPPPEERPLPPLRKPIPIDTRFAGPFGQAASVVNPPKPTKMQFIIDEIKETSYQSYWKAPLGKVRDPVPMMPEGFDYEGTTFGKPTPYHGRLYDIVMPKNPQPVITPPHKALGAQVDRNYCAPPYRSDVVFGHRTFVNKWGAYAKCCLTDDSVIKGNGGGTVINTIQSNMLDAKQPRIGTVLAPNNNVSEVPAGYSFGMLKTPDNLPQCLTNYEINPEIEFSRKCLKHLNTLRKALSTRFLPTFFYKFYLTLKYFDTEKSGWLPKDVVYSNCGKKLIRFDPGLIEPLLSVWHAFDGQNIEYRTFVRVINYKLPSAELPKISAFEPSCLDYSTTYTEMVKPDQEPDRSPMAGLPSGRYIDLDYPIDVEGYCKAHKICLPQEVDMKSCIAPSILTHVFVSHRDMYAIREPEKLRKVFEAAGEKFSDERFNMIWEEAKKLHSKGYVCYETFRQTMNKYPDPVELEENK